MSQGLWAYVEGTIIAPNPPTSPIKPSPLDPNASTADRQQYADDEKQYKEDTALYAIDV